MCDPRPEESREDLVAVARRRESGVTITWIASAPGRAPKTLSAA